jgi:hypothetical protein
VGATEWFLLALVILVPLVIAVAVTLWSLEQVRYRPKRARPVRQLKTTEPPPSSDPTPPAGAS